MCVSRCNFNVFVAAKRWPQSSHSNRRFIIACSGMFSSLKDFFLYFFAKIKFEDQYILIRCLPMNTHPNVNSYDNEDC